MEFSEYLVKMIDTNASDLFISVGAPPQIKIEGNMQPIGNTSLSSSQVRDLVYSMLTDEQTKEFESTSELNMALHIKDMGRFRFNVFRQMGEVALVARHIKSDIPSIDVLGLPSILNDLILEPRGLILLVGGTGTGKSTTLASMIDFRNRNKTGHILSIEDPVEFVHENKKSLINQREVGIDTKSYSVALSNAMREAPDVIMIGEIRDMETMKSVIAYSETGHLCLSTLHANNANQAIDRIINFFPDSAHRQILQDLSLNLRAIVSQRLPKGTKKKRVAAIEVMINTPYISDLISKGEVSKIKEAMIQAREQGCQTFDDALFELTQAGKISEDEALQHADSRNNLKLRIKLEGKKSESEIRFKKNVGFSKYADFSDYKKYRINCVSVSNDSADRVSAFEDEIRNVMSSKGLQEESINPDIELKYIYTTKVMEQLKLEEIENSVSSEININNDVKKFGMLKVNVVDMNTKKVVWQVSASAEMAVKPKSISELNEDVEYLLNEFPPQ